MGHLLGFPGPPQTPITSDASHPTLTSTGSNSSLVNSWSHHYASLPAAPLLSRSGASAQAATPLPYLNRNYVFLLSHASTATGQSVVSTAPSSFRNAGYNLSYQFPSYVLHPPNFRHKQVPPQPQSSHASLDMSEPFLADMPIFKNDILSSAVFECELQLESRLLTRTTLTQGDTTLYTHSHAKGLGTSVSIETSISPTDCWQREGDTDGNAGQEGTWLIGSASPAYDPSNDDACLKDTPTNLAVGRGIVTEAFKTPNDLGSAIWTSFSGTTTVASPTCTGPGSDANTASEPMSEADAWEKMMAQPGFKTFLKIVGVHGID